MSKTTSKTPVTESTTDSSYEESHVDRLLRLSEAISARQRTRESDRMARTARARGWTREELYERGSPDSD